MKQEVSDEILGAYVDDELACSEKRLIADKINSDPELKSRVQALLDLKTSLKSAYADTTFNQKSEEPDLSSKASKLIFKQSIAASFILTCGLVVGAMINLSGNTPGQLVSAKTDDTLFGINIKPVSQQNDKILLHISSADLDKLDFLLTKTEQLLTDSRHSKNPLSIEVIANSRGVDLLRKTKTPYAQRIQKLQNQYSNLQFIACENTIRRLKQEGQTVQMINNVKTDKPALDTIINRMDQGWTYIKI